MIFANETPQIAAFNLFTTWHSRFYHANIKTNMGFLRYIFVTPQSHRIHHSIQRHHRDKNFAVIFSFWDRLFGTQVKSYEEYPETGIQETEFPFEKKNSVSSWIITPLKQLLYPFGAIAQSAFGKR